MWKSRGWKEREGQKPGPSRGGSIKNRGGMPSVSKESGKMEEGERAWRASVASTVQPVGEADRFDNNPESGEKKKGKRKEQENGELGGGALHSLLRKSVPVHRVSSSWGYSYLRTGCVPVGERSSGEKGPSKKTHSYITGNGAVGNMSTLLTTGEGEKFHLLTELKGGICSARPEKNQSEEPGSRGKKKEKK